METISIDRILGYIRGLCQYENRLAGSETEKEAAEYIKDLLHGFGYNEVKMTKFPVYGWVPKKCAVEVISPVKRRLEAAVFPYSNSVSVEASLVTINHTDEIALSSREGMIGLAPWGEHLYLSAMRTYYVAQKQKLSAVLIASPDEGDLRKRVVVEVGGEMGLPLISISKEDGAILEGLMEQGEVRIRVETEVNVDADASSQNLEVMVPGDGSVGHELIVGAHYDAYFQGAADNAAPVAIVLELARILRMNAERITPRRTVRFLFYGAEECGSTSYYYWVNGSRAYVEANSDAVARTGAILSLDSVGFNAPNYVATTLCLTGFAKGLRVQMKNPPTVTFYGPAAYGSDHWFFEKAGVPTIYGVSFPSPLYHTQRDDVEHLNMKSVQFHAEFMRAALSVLMDVTLLPLDIFAPLERFRSILEEYMNAKDLPFDLGILLRKIERIINEKKAFEKMAKTLGQTENIERIEEVNAFLVSTVNWYNQTIGWVWRKSPPSDVSYLSKLELLVDYSEISAAISALRRMPIANLDLETVVRYKAQDDNPFNWVDVHNPLESLEDERSRIFRAVDEEISRLSDFLSRLHEKVRIFASGP